MSRIVKAKGVWLLLMVLALSVWMLGCTSKEDKTINAIGAPDFKEPKASVQGIMVDNCTGEALAGVRVSMAYSGSLHWVDTDASGLFYFNDVPANTSNALDNLGATVAAAETGNSYIINADFTKYNELNPSRGYPTSVQGYLTLKYESYDDAASQVGAEVTKSLENAIATIASSLIGSDSDVDVDLPRSRLEELALSLSVTASPSYSFTVTGSGAVTPVDGLAGGIRLSVASPNAALVVDKVVSGLDGVTPMSVAMNVYSITLDSEGDIASKTFVKSFSYSKDTTTAQTISGLMPKQLYILEATDLLNVSSLSMSKCYFALTCKETLHTGCIKVYPAKCDDVSPYIASYDPQNLTEAESDTAITITFSEPMDTVYPPISSDPYDFLDVQLLGYAANDGASFTDYPIGFTAAWQSSTVLKLTPDTPLPLGSLIQVQILTPTLFADINGNKLAATASTLSPRSLPTNYKWTFNVNCGGSEIDIASSSITQLKEVPDSTTMTGYAYVPDTKIVLSWTAPTGCVSKYKFYVMSGATTCEIPQYLGTSYDITTPAGNPSTNNINSPILLSNATIQNVITWTKFDNKASRTLVIGVSAVNCDGFEGAMGKVTVQDVTPPSPPANLVWNLDNNEGRALANPGPLDTQCVTLPIGHLTMTFDQALTGTLSTGSFVFFNTQDPVLCTGTNTDVPTVTAVKFATTLSNGAQVIDPKTVIMTLDNVFLADKYDNLKVVAPFKDSMGNATLRDAVVLLSDKLAPTITKVVFNEQTNKSWVTGATPGTAENDLVTVYYSEEMGSVLATQINTYNGATSYLNTANFASGGNNPTPVAGDRAGVKGEYKVTYALLDGELDSVGAPITSGPTTLGPTDKKQYLMVWNGTAPQIGPTDLNGNILLPPAALQPQNATVVDWNLVVDNITPKIMGGMNNAAAANLFASATSIPAGNNPDFFEIDVTFTEPVIFAATDISVTGLPANVSGAVGTVFTNGAADVTKASTTWTFTLTINNTSGAAVNTGDNAAIKFSTNVKDKAGNSLNSATVQLKQGTFAVGAP